MDARFYVAAAALLFSTGGAVIKLSTLSAWQIAGARSAIAAVVLWLLIPSWRRMNRDSFIVGTAYAMTMISYVTANRLTTAANAIFLQAAAPMYVLFLGPWLLGEKTRTRDLPGVALIALGLWCLLTTSEVAVATAPDPTRGDWIAAASGVTWALTLVGLRWLSTRTTHSEGDPSGAAVIAGNLMASVACLPFAWPLRSVAPALDSFVVTYLGVFQIGLAYVCLVRAVRGARVLDVALLLLLEPLLNAGFAWLIHGETPSSWALLGYGAITLGLLAQAFGARPERRAS